MKIAKSLYPSKAWIENSDTCLFPRNQHPDTRSRKEFFDVLRVKLKNKKHRHGNPDWKPRPIVCLNTGFVYDSVSDAARKIGINKGSIGGIMSGRIKNHHLGLKFKYL